MGMVAVDEAWGCCVSVCFWLADGTLGTLYFVINDKLSFLHGHLWDFCANPARTPTWPPKSHSWRQSLASQWSWSFGRSDYMAQWWLVVFFFSLSLSLSLSVSPLTETDKSTTPPKQFPLNSAKLFEAMLCPS